MEQFVSDSAVWLTTQASILKIYEILIRIFLSSPNLLSFLNNGQKAVGSIDTVTKSITLHEVGASKHMILKHCGLHEIVLYKLS